MPEERNVESEIMATLWNPRYPAHVRTLRGIASETHLSSEILESALRNIEQNYGGVIRSDGRNLVFCLEAFYQLSPCKIGTLFERVPADWILSEASSHGVSSLNILRDAVTPQRVRIFPEGEEV